MPEGTNITLPKGEKRATPIGSRVLEGPITRDFDEFPSFTASMSNSTGPRAVRMGRDGSVLAVLPFVAILIVPYHIREILIPPFILGDSLA